MIIYASQKSDRNVTKKSSTIQPIVGHAKDVNIF